MSKDNDKGKEQTKAPESNGTPPASQPKRKPLGWGGAMAAARKHEANAKKKNPTAIPLLTEEKQLEEESEKVKDSIPFDAPEDIGKALAEAHSKSPEKPEEDPELPGGVLSIKKSSAQRFNKQATRDLFQAVTGSVLREFPELQEESLGIIQGYLDNGADINVKNTKGQNLREIAERKGLTILAEFFKEKGLVTTQEIEHDLTKKTLTEALFNLVEKSDDIKSLKWGLEKYNVVLGDLSTLTNEKGQTLLQAAEANGRTQITTYIYEISPPAILKQHLFEAARKSDDDKGFESLVNAIGDRLGDLTHLADPQGKSLLQVAEFYHNPRIAGYLEKEVFSTATPAWTTLSQSLTARHRPPSAKAQEESTTKVSSAKTSRSWREDQENYKSRTSNTRERIEEKKAGQPQQPDAKDDWQNKAGEMRKRWQERIDAAREKERDPSDKGRK